MSNSFWILSWLPFKSENSISSFKEYFLLEVVSPIFNLSFFVLIASFTRPNSDLNTWVIGNSFLLSANLSLFRVGSIMVKERYNGRLETLIASPSSTFRFILANTIFPVIVSTITTIFGLQISSYFFSQSIHLSFSLFLIIISSMFSSVCFGLFLSNLAFITDSLNFLLNLFYYILLMFSGANFPISQLPHYLRFINDIIPLSHGITSAKLYLSNSNFKYQLFLELLVGIFYLNLTIFFSFFLEKKARQIGKLGSF
ncbi:ABC transporter permease [Lactobacillus sp. CC-MHH1034]|uniref:ABC transporter permease n=1 Tax=Agrilactobacillus fermenti TaxID=2586909 RepID=UPI001E596944|nr:ABC transporter permease [Agrilactobacillus fermenti]MCD2257440.1 ABC transporter permease [Agrilactobacillus fermenti]